MRHSASRRWIGPEGVCLAVAVGLHLGLQALLALLPEAAVRNEPPVMVEFSVGALEPWAAGTAAGVTPAGAAAAAELAAVVKRPARRAATATTARREPRRPGAAPDVNDDALAADVSNDARAADLNDDAAGVGDGLLAGARAGGDGAMAGGGAHGAGHAGAGAPLHGPGLLSRGEPCAGYFPASADAASGVVRVVVQVDESGHARPQDVLLEYPVGEGFAEAARACAEHLRFAPARDGRGAAVPGRAKLELRFRRTVARDARG